MERSLYQTLLIIGVWICVIALATASLGLLASAIVPASVDDPLRIGSLFVALQSIVAIAVLIVLLQIDINNNDDQDK